MAYLESLNRQSITEGQLVVRGRGSTARQNVYKVVDVKACNYWGERSKGGRYCAIRRWDTEKGEFKEGATRTGEKPADLYDFAAYLRAWEADFAKYAEDEAKIIDEYNAVQGFFDGLGLGECVRVCRQVVPQGQSYVTGYSLSMYDDNIKKMLTELGVIPAREGA